MPIHSCTLPSGGKGFKWGGSGKCYPDRASAERQAAAAHANGFHGDRALAFDKASVRTIDTDGRMHISVTPISKANVCGYYGSEIPNGESLGLDAGKLYKLLRDPKELEKAAPTFNNLPLLRKHVRATAADPQKDSIVGSTGSECKFKAPYLENSLAIWDAVAIAGVITQEQCELSSSYHYEADMTPGEFKGEKYDGVMTNIRGNHVALVEKGRAGPDVVVSDEAPPIKELKMANPATALSRKALFASGAVAAYLHPLLANDQKVDLNPVFKGVTAKNFAQKQASIVKGIAAASKGKLAQDADLDTIVDLLDSVSKTNTGEEADPLDPADPVTGDNDADLSFLEGKISPEDMERLCAIMKSKGAPEAKPPGEAVEGAAPPATDEGAGPGEGEAFPPKEKEDTDVTNPIMKPAMDAAIKKATDDTIARMNAVREAEKAVRPFIGELAIAQDSAENVYKLALDAAGIDTKGVPPAAYSAMVRMLPKPGDVAAQPRLAADAASMAGFASRYPNAARLRSV